MDAVERLAPEVGTKTACEAFGVPRATLYRRWARRAAPPVEQKKRSSPPRALSEEEKQVVLDILHSERFMDRAPHEVYATLLDEGKYHCSVSTMYRILKAVSYTHLTLPTICSV